jgi:hypothetical protein
MTRTAEDFEWVNSWAEASGLNAAREFAAQPVKAASPAVPPPRTAPVAATKSPAATYPITVDQLARDVGEIEQARDAIIAAEGKGVFVLPGPQRRKRPGILRRHDTVPVLIGAMLALFALIVYGAVASIVALGR